MTLAILVGLGQVGMGYDLSSTGKILNQTMTHLKALTESEHFNLAAVVDCDFKKLETAKKVYSVRAELSLVEVSVREKVGLLTVATSTNSHRNLLDNLPEYLEPKVMLIEKPVGMSQLDANWVLDWARKKSIQVHVNYFRDYLPEVEKARLHIRNLNLGPLISIKISAYGELLNIFSHFIELSNHLTGMSLFCACPKDLSGPTASSLESRCTKCRVKVNLSGIGQPKRTCTVRIEFSNYRLQILDDGKTILVKNLEGNVLQAFSTPVEDYNNYQSFVYDYIATLPLGDSSRSGIEQAIQVHNFIESVENTK